MSERSKNTKESPILYVVIGKTLDLINPTL